MRFGELELKARAILREAGVDSPGLCARMLAQAVAGVDQAAYPLIRMEEMPQSTEEILRALIKRRARGEPMAHILGHKEFYEHDFIVSIATLIPRPETEIIVERALSSLPPTPILFADAGCGCGCIGLSLLAARPAWRGILFDNSRDALKIAQINAKKIAPAATLVEADIFAFSLAAGKYDLIVANPPYIAREDIGRVMPEVLRYEPHAALFSEKCGLAHLQAVAEMALHALRPGGLLMLEHGDNQGDSVCKILFGLGYPEVADYRDDADLPRCVVARKV